MSFKNIAVLGAGGNVGKPVVKALLESGFKVTAVSRTDSTSTFPDDVQVVRGNYEDSEFWKKAFTGQDAVILAIGSGTLQSQKAIIDAAVAAGVKRIIPSEFGSDTTDPVVVKAVPFYQGKLEIVDHLKKAVSGTTTTWTSIVTGPFYDWCLEYGTAWGFDIKNKKATLYDNGTNKFDTTNLVTVGKAVAKVVSLPELYQNQHVYISEYTISQLDIFAAIQKATGTSASEWTVEHRTAESLRQEGYAMIEKNDYSGVLNLIFAAIFQAGNGSEFSSIRKLENEALGLQAEDLVSVTKRIVG